MRTANVVISIALGLGLSMAAGLFGCTGTYAASVRTRPPPTRVAYIDERPGYVWIDGRWVWNGYDWVWYDGYWVAERPGFVWVQGDWYWHRGEYRWRDGHWRRSEVRVRDHRDDRGRVVVPVREEVRPPARVRGKIKVRVR